MDNIKICVYAICKNEIQFVDKWLDNMSEADYIVVLDTGSTDGTFEKLDKDQRVDKVKKKVINPWRFDVARNESMKLIPRDTTVCVCTDFDELFEQGWANKIRERWTENSWRGHYRYVWSHTDTGAMAVTYVYDKIHSYNPKYKWYYPVHEVLGLEKEGLLDTTQIERNGNHNVEFENDIILHHFPDMSKQRGYYFDLLKLRVEENHDSFSMYLLGREYGINKDYDTAIKVFEQTLEMPDIGLYPLAHYSVLGYLGDCYRLTDNLVSAITCYNLQLQADNTYLEPYCRLGALYQHMGFSRIAVGIIEEGLSKAYRHGDWAETGESWNGLPYDILSVAYCTLKEKDKALEYAVKALKLMPNNERVRNNYLSVLDMN